MLLGLVSIGLGHLYAGRPIQGLLLGLTITPVFLGLMTIGAYTGTLVPCLYAGLAAVTLAWLGQAIHAGWSARRAPSDRIAPFNRWWIYGAFFLLQAALVQQLAWQVRRSVVEPFRVPSESMEPGLRPGDQVFVVKVGPDAEIGRGHVVFFRVPERAPGRYGGQIFLKRVIALAGEQVEIRDAQVVVDGATIAQQPCEPPEYTYLQQSGHGPVKETGRCLVEGTGDRGWRILLAPDGGQHSTPATQVPAGQLFLLGDNRDNSWDSRHLGPVPRDAVIGRVAVVWLSWGAGEGMRWSRIGLRP